MSVQLIDANAKFNFLGKAKFAFALSFLLLAGSVYVWIDRGEEKFGIDYKGGHKIVVKFDESVEYETAPDSESIRAALKVEGVENAVVQRFTELGALEYSIRLTGSVEDSSSVRQLIVTAMKNGFGDNFEIVQTDFVGPTVGGELQREAVIAILIGLVGILGYISFRFELAFALGAVAALFHDVVICMGIYLVSGLTLSVATLAAALTIVGYSVNDTIIVFDRMREEILKQKKFDLIDLMNHSINATLSRTVITSLLTLFSALALLIFGGGAIKDLSLFLVVGVIAGTYSTIFIASPVALGWENLRSKLEKRSSSQ